jgi:rRNA maturation RNase YbeY
MNQGAVRYTDHEVRSRLTARRALSAYLRQLIQGYRPEVKAIELSYVFCSDAYLYELNLTHLVHDELTDIITFDLSDNAEKIIAEVYISIDTVAENARLFGEAYQRELHRVIFHGVLHLCGLKDKTPDEKLAMRAAEDNCLNEYLK